MKGSVSQQQVTRGHAVFLQGTVQSQYCTSRELGHCQKGPCIELNAIRAVLLDFLLYKAPVNKRGQRGSSVIATCSHRKGSAAPRTESRGNWHPHRLHKS